MQIIPDTTSLSAKAKRDMGVYLHIPFCRKKCSYCDFASYEGLEAYYDDYVEALCKEIELWAQLHEASRYIPVDTIYFGGGTPTMLSIEQLQRILKTLYTYYDCRAVRELSIEANPGEVDRAYLQDLKQLGVTRLSYGVQTFDDNLLTILRRGHTAASAKSAIEDALTVGFKSVSGDLIYALPGQELQDIRNDVSTLVNLGVNHVSIYGLQLEEGTNLHKQVSTGEYTLPDDDTNEAMYDCMLDALQANGFERYEISNFTNNQAYSRHNLRYWQYKEYLAFGSGAYSFYENVRRNNEPYVVPYINRLRQNLLPVVFEESISAERALEDYCFLALRTKWGLSSSAFEAAFNQSLETVYGDELKHLTELGLLELYDERSVQAVPGLGHSLLALHDERRSQSVSGLGQSLSEADSLTQPVPGLKPVMRNFDESAIIKHNAWRLTREGAKHGNYVFSQFIR